MSSNHQHSPTVYHNLCKFSDPCAAIFLHVLAELTRLWEISAKHFKDHDIKKHIAYFKATDHRIYIGFLFFEIKGQNEHINLSLLSIDFYTDFKL